MIRAGLRATTALGLCFALVPFAAFAKVFGTAPELVAEAVAESEFRAPMVGDDEIRLSRDDFGSRMTLDFDEGQARRDGAAELDRAGLGALGMLGVGMIADRGRFVGRSDERVVILRENGEFALWRDDDAILRQTGSQRRVESYADGSTLTRWQRADRSQVLTIRDVTGRVLWRERIMSDGTSIELVNDMREVDPLDFSVLPAASRNDLRISEGSDPDMALALLHDAEADVRTLDRAFTLRQVRENRQLRDLVPVLSPEPIVFRVNDASVRADEAMKLAQVGRLIERLVAENPRELFLVEGHTDATGPAAFNLALSDRRAESVALALVESFAIHPENLIVQGYGERHLHIPTAEAESGNRRVAIRRISPLLGQ